MNIALLYTPDTDDADMALRAAHDLAEGLGSEGENISVLTPVPDATWITGGTTEEAGILLDALRSFADAHGEHPDAGAPDHPWTVATRMIEAIESQVGE